MSEGEEASRGILRNMLIGRWAGEVLGLPAQEVAAYSEGLARWAMSSGIADVFSKLRCDFDKAGVRMSDADILEKMTQITIESGRQLPRKAGDGIDRAAAMLSRNLKKP